MKKLLLFLGTIGLTTAPIIQNVASANNAVVPLTPNSIIENEEQLESNTLAVEEKGIGAYVGVTQGVYTYTDNDPYQPKW